MPMKPRTNITRGIKTLGYLLAVALLLTTTGCNELNQLADLEEIEKLLAQMERDSCYEPPLISSIMELVPTTDSIKTDFVTFDSLPPNTLQTTFKKVRLDGHEYWIIATMGHDMGGAGITHSESCWCKRMILFNGTSSVPSTPFKLTKPSPQSKSKKHQKAK